MERFNSFSSDQIVVTKRQASMIMASMLLFCLFVFITGFFLGKRTIIDDFSSKVTKEALHDQIDFLLTTQSFESAQETPAIIEAEPVIESSEVIVVADTPDSMTLNSGVLVAERQEKHLQSHDEPVDVDDAIKVENTKPQYAQLIGFGSKQAAQAFVNRLKKHNVPVILKTIMSKTSSGKQRTWYQAITLTYESEQELQENIAKVKRLEHIRGSDIKIVYVK